jgi:hypothetical protein
MKILHSPVKLFPDAILLGKKFSMTLRYRTLFAERYSQIEVSQLAVHAV